MICSATEVGQHLALACREEFSTFTEAYPVAGYEHGGVGEQLNVFLPSGRVETGNPAAMAATLAGWYKNPPTPKLPVPAPYRREDMITAHLKLYHELCLS